MLPSPLRQSLYLAQAAAAATLLRSILFDRWITVFVALLLIAGTAAAQRSKTWGIGLSLASAVALLGMWGLGIAPGWFCLVGAVGALPFLLTWRKLARFDAAATAVLTALAVLAGSLVAGAWRVTAPFLFWHVPFIAPSRYPEHVGLVGLGLFAFGGLLAVRKSTSRGRELPDGLPVADVRYRVAGYSADAPVRAGVEELDADEGVDVEGGEDSFPRRRRRV